MDKTNVEVDRLSLHGHRVSDSEHQISNTLVFLLFYHSTFKRMTLSYSTPLSFVMGETVYQPIFTD